jgi:hypothetical protein
MTDPLSAGPQKTLEAIGLNLQKQYERWQPRARYKQSLDPTVDEVKKLCSSLRRNAKVGQIKIEIRSQHENYLKCFIYCFSAIVAQSLRFFLSF